MDLSKFFVQCVACSLLMLVVFVCCTEKDEEVSSSTIPCSNDEERISWRYGPYLTICDMHCPPECTCILGDHVLLTTCDNVTVSAEIQYPPNVIHLNLSYVILHGVQSDALTTFGDLLKELDLSDNRIEKLLPGMFSGLFGLRYLDLQGNDITILPQGVFDSLGNLRELNLQGNNIAMLPQDIFAPLSWLFELNIQGNSIAELPQGVFASLGGLDTLNLQSNNIAILPQGVFDSLGNLDTLNLQSNNIGNLPQGVFASLGGLDTLNLQSNNIGILPQGVFASLGRLWYLDLQGNDITILPQGVFASLHWLRVLNLQGNSIAMLQQDVFVSLGNLLELNLQGNNIATLSPGAFNGIYRIKNLNLTHHKLRILPVDIFQSCNLLEDLLLGYNQLAIVYKDSFTGLRSLTYLNLTHNELSILETGIFGDLQKVQVIDLSFNNLKKLGQHLFKECLNLGEIDLRWNTEWIRDSTNSKAFASLNSSTKVYVTDDYSCCFIFSAKCSFDLKSPFRTCQRLLAYAVLRGVMWMVCFGALIGNLAVLFSRMKNRKRNKVENILIANLSVSDFLMAIYLLTLLAVDTYYAETFPSHSDQWRKSSLCKVANGLSVLSSEASVLLITFISMERFWGMLHPFGGQRLGTKSARVVVSLLWVVAVVLSTVSSVLSGVDPDVYDVSEVCIGLPISRYPISVETGKFSLTDSSDNKTMRSIVTHTNAGSSVGMYLSIAMFIGLNFVSFVIVAVCYVGIFVTKRTSSSDAGRTFDEEEIKLAKKIAAIILTDFFCWMPVVLLSILVQSGAVTVDPVVYAWIATFVLPINSAINPFLYTLSTVLYNRYEKKMRKLNQGMKKRRSLRKVICIRSRYWLRHTLIPNRHWLRRHPFFKLLDEKLMTKQKNKSNQDIKMRRPLRKTILIRSWLRHTPIDIRDWLHRTLIPRRYWLRQHPFFKILDEKLMRKQKNKSNPDIEMRHLR